jgi:hypothetical protein
MNISNSFIFVKIGYCLALLVFIVFSLIVHNQIKTLSRIIVLPYSETSLLLVSRLFTIIAATLLILALVLL